MNKWKRFLLAIMMTFIYKGCGWVMKMTGRSVGALLPQRTSARTTAAVQVNFN